MCVYDTMHSVRTINDSIPSASTRDNLHTSNTQQPGLQLDMFYLNVPAQKQDYDYELNLLFAPLKMQFGVFTAMLLKMRAFLDVTLSRPSQKT